MELAQAAVDEDEGRHGGGFFAFRQPSLRG
jgi:hypothetical protein